jgi:hypothetical protein
MVPARTAAWNSYWTLQRRDQLRSWLTEAARVNGFQPAAFSAYADRLVNFHVPDAVDRLRQSPAALFPGFIEANRAAPTIAMLVTMNPPTDRNAHQLGSWAGELRLRFPPENAVHARVLSGSLLMADATERARAEGERFAPWCMLAILLPLWLYCRRLRRAWLVMLCLVVGFLWVLGAAQLFGHGLNLLSLVPILFTLGVTVDYGIYAVSAAAANGARQPAAEGAGQHGGVETARAGATFLCALTTILGAGSLLVSQHPAMRWLGMTLVAGITGGYLTSLLIVRHCLHRPLLPPRLIGKWNSSAGGPLGSSMAGRFLLGAARTLRGIALLMLTFALAVPVLADWKLAHERPPGLPNPPAPPPSAHPVSLQVGPRAYRVGNSWMRWFAAPDGSGLWEMRLAGDAQDRGRAIAQLAGPIDLRIENEMLDQLDYFLPQEWARWLVLRGMAVNLLDLPSYVPPEYQREIYWAAVNHPDPHAYLAPTYSRILSYHALHDISQMLIDNPLIVPTSFACTGVVSLPAYSSDTAGHLLLARNFDFEGGESFGRQKSITSIIPPAGSGKIPFVHVAWPGLSGVVTGMNAEHVALFLNAAATADHRRIGTPTIFMARRILEEAHSIADAREIIRRTPVFVSDIIVVADGKTGETRIFEKSPRGTDSYPVADSAVVANHLVTPRFTNDATNRERQRDGTTTQRFARARQLLDRLKHHVTPQALAQLLRDKKGLDDKPLGLGNRNAIDGLIACHGVIMDATAGKMWVAAWPYVEGAFVEVNVEAMLDPALRYSANPVAWASTLMGPDSMMLHTDSDVSAGTPWERLQASREAARASLEALKRPGGAAEALAKAEEVVRTNPDFYEGYELRGRALFQLGRYADARRALELAMDRDPPYAQHREALKDLIRQCER